MTSHETIMSYCPGQFTPFVLSFGHATWISARTGHRSRLSSNVDHNAVIMAPCHLVLSRDGNTPCLINPLGSPCGLSWLPVHMPNAMLCSIHVRLSRIPCAMLDEDIGQNFREMSTTHHMSTWGTTETASFHLQGSSAFAKIMATVGQAGQQQKCGRVSGGTFGVRTDVL